MPNDLTQTAMQPYVKLVQSNLELMAKFSVLPETAAQAGGSPQDFMKQSQEAVAKLMQSGQFAQLAQGMLKNYTEFMTEVGQAGMAMLTQGQTAMMRQFQEASAKVMQASQGGGRGG